MSCPGDRETVARLPRCTCGESPERRFICLKSLQLGRPSPIRGRADPPVPDHIALEPVLPAYRVGHDHDRVGVERPDCVVDRLRGIGISDLALHVQRFTVADADSWSWPESAYDVVAAIFIQFASPDLRRRMFDRIAQTLRPGGLLLLEGYRVEQLAYGTGGPRSTAQLYTEEQLRTELAVLRLEQLRSYDEAVEEGGAHSGMSALIDVVARRPIA